MKRKICAFAGGMIGVVFLLFYLKSGSGAGAHAGAGLLGAIAAVIGTGIGSLVGMLLFEE